MDQFSRDMYWRVTNLAVSVWQHFIPLITINSDREHYCALDC